VRAQVELDRVREVKSHFDVKVNDIVLAMVAGGLRGYLQEIDALPRQPLVVQCPVSLRTDDSRSDVGSKVGSLFVSLATDLDDPVERLRKIAESTGTAKDMHERMARHQRLGVTEILSPAFIGIAARLYTSMHLDRTPPPVNLVVSNVPGPPFTLYVAGAPLVGMYPMGPLLLGMGLNVTAFSHGGHIDIGLFTCPDLVKSPELISSHMLDALSQLEAAR
jgi:diacylglycerol O-acyltransferase / wax synthase